MNTHADKTQEHTSVTASSAKKQSSGESTLQFVNNKPEALAQRKLQAMANNSPKAKQLKALQKMASQTVQMRRVSVSQLRGGGLTGPNKGNTYNYNPGNGIHITVRKSGPDVTHFHVRKDTKGGVYNRIDYNEDDKGDWIESNVNVPAGGDLETQMKNAAADMIAWLKGLPTPPS